MPLVRLSTLGLRLTGRAIHARRAALIVRVLSTPPSSSSPTSTSGPPHSPTSAPTTPSSSATPAQPVTPSPKTSSRIPDRYRSRLLAVAQHTGVPLPTLGISFLVLHELTALVPLVLVYYILGFFGAGAWLVDWVTAQPSSSSGGTARQANAQHTQTPAEGASGAQVADRMEEAVNKGEWWRALVLGWVEEGQKRVEKVGKRYGILGYEKPDPSSGSPTPSAAASTSESGREIASVNTITAGEEAAEQLVHKQVSPALGPTAGQKGREPRPVPASQDRGHGGVDYNTAGEEAVEEEVEVQVSPQARGTAAKNKGPETTDVIQAIQARAPGMDQVANAIGAYVVVKAFLPVRLGVCLAGAAPFARFALLPIQRAVRNIFRR